LVQLTLSRAQDRSRCAWTPERLTWGADFQLVEDVGKYLCSIGRALVQRLKLLFQLVHGFQLQPRWQPLKALLASLQHSRRFAPVIPVISPLTKLEDLPQCMHISLSDASMWSLSLPGSAGGTETSVHDATNSGLWAGLCRGFHKASVL